MQVVVLVLPNINNTLFIVSLWDYYSCVKRNVMESLSVVGNAFGCSASGERLVSAARDGDFQEAKALLEYNPRLAKYTTFGGRNSPLHHSAARGHHEVAYIPALLFIILSVLF